VLVASHSQSAVAQRREPSPLERDPDVTAIATGARDAWVAAPSPLATDTLPARRRPVAIEYSDWYGRRLRIHQISSWAMLPLFVAQYAAGQQLLDKGDERAPKWAKDWHEPLAGATGALFAVNTVTGGWNLWDARRDPQARKWRTAHALLMLVADAGFALTPAFADDDDEEGGEGGGSRLKTHKTVALTSMRIAVASWVMMLPPFRRE
jgi:hypothetical protein